MARKSRKKKQPKSSRKSLVNVRRTKAKEHFNQSNSIIPPDQQTVPECPLSSVPTELNGRSLLRSSFKRKYLRNEKKKSPKKKTSASKRFANSPENDHSKSNVCPLEIFKYVTSETKAALKRKRDDLTEENSATRHVLARPETRLNSNKLPLSVDPRMSLPTTSSGRFSRDKILNKDSVDESLLMLSILSQKILNSLSEGYSELESKKEECSCKRGMNYASTPRDMPKLRAFNELKLSPINSFDQINANTITAKSCNPIKAVRHSRVSRSEVARTNNSKKNTKKFENSNMESTGKPQISRKLGKSLKTVNSIKKCRPKSLMNSANKKIYSFRERKFPGSTDTNCQVSQESHDETNKCSSLSSSTKKEKSNVPVSRHKIPVGYQNKLLSSDINISFSDYELEGEAEELLILAPEESTAAKICREMKLLGKHSVVENKTSKHTRSTAPREKEHFEKLELRKKPKMSNKIPKCRQLRPANYGEEMAPQENLFHHQTSSKKPVKQRMQPRCVSMSSNSVSSPTIISSQKSVCSPRSKPIFGKKKNYSIDHPSVSTERAQIDSNETPTFAETANLKQFNSLKKPKSELPRRVSAKNPSTKFNKSRIAHTKSNAEKTARNSKNSNQSSKQLSGNCKHGNKIQDPRENKTLIHLGDQCVPNYRSGSKVVTAQHGCNRNLSFNALPVLSPDQQPRRRSKKRNSLKTAEGIEYKATKSLSRKVLPQEKKTTSVKKHSTSLGNVRQSTRTRRRPLCPWLNERARYRTLKNGDIEFVDIAT